MPQPKISKAYILFPVPAVIATVIIRFWFLRQSMNQFAFGCGYHRRLYCTSRVQSHQTLHQVLSPLKSRVGLAVDGMNTWSERCNLCKTTHHSEHLINYWWQWCRKLYVCTTLTPNGVAANNAGTTAGFLNVLVWPVVSVKAEPSAEETMPIEYLIS